MDEDNKDKKPIPVGPGETTSAISLGGKTLASMLGSVTKPKDASQLNAEIMMSPTGSMNVIPPTKGRYVQEAEAQAALLAEARPRQKPAPVVIKPKAVLFQRGDRAYDIKSDVNVTVLRAAVDFTSEGVPIHEVADKRGKTWRRRESRLVRRQS